LATAEAQQKVVERQTELAQLAAARREAELLAEVVKPAEAAREQAVIEAEAAKRQTVLAAEADAEKQRLDGEGQAARIRAMSEAEGAAIRAKLMAEAEGTLAKARALKELNEAGQLILILERLPQVLAALEPVAAAFAAPMGNIDSVQIYDFGGQGTGPAKFAGNSVAFLKTLFEQAQSMGVNLGGLQRVLGGGTPATPAAGVSAPAPEAETAPEAASPSAGGDTPRSRRS
jgi:flotillin